MLKMFSAAPVPRPMIMSTILWLQKRDFAASTIFTEKNL